MLSSAWVGRLVHGRRTDTRTVVHSRSVVSGRQRGNESTVGTGGRATNVCMYLQQNRVRGSEGKDQRDEHEAKGGGVLPPCLRAACEHMPLPTHVSETLQVRSQRAQCTPWHWLGSLRPARARTIRSLRPGPARTVAFNRRHVDPTATPRGCVFLRAAPAGRGAGPESPSRRKTCRRIRSAWPPWSSSAAPAGSWSCAGCLVHDTTHSEGTCWVRREGTCNKLAVRISGRTLRVDPELQSVRQRDCEVSRRCSRSAGKSDRACCRGYDCRQQQCHRDVLALTAHPATPRGPEITGRIL